MFEEPRFDTTKLAPEPMKLFRELDSVLGKQLEPRLFHLLQYRASQINGCAYCMYMHSHDALAAGESPQRLFVLDAWHESPLFTDKERAALAWVEAITKISETHAPREVYDDLRAHFSEQEIANLTLAAALINAMNRIAIPARTKHPARVTAGNAAGRQPPPEEGTDRYSATASQPPST
ncbi:MAG: carboxymuconolactone decarboxylase family protein [Acetobacteraceae bacterium]|nr:carboxymuconolactone decarboxylase family protein [Acetobacteraceae bacterium]